MAWSRYCSLFSYTSLCLGVLRCQGSAWKNMKKKFKCIFYALYFKTHHYSNGPRRKLNRSSYGDILVVEVFYCITEIISNLRCGEFNFVMRPNWNPNCKMFHSAPVLPRNRSRKVKAKNQKNTYSLIIQNSKTEVCFFFSFFFFFQSKCCASFNNDRHRELATRLMFLLRSR